jgi:hypothetical protein
MPTPAPERQCTAISAKTGERCPNFAMKSMLGVEGVEPLCSGHAHQPIEAARRGRKAQAQAAREEAERVRLAGAEGQLRDATKRLDEADPLDPDSFTRALTEKEEHERRLRRILEERAIQQAEALEPPSRTPDMARQGLYWVKRGCNPSHPIPADAVQAPDGSMFVWAMDTIAPYGGARRPGVAPDPDAQRLRVERAEARDVEFERATARELRELLDEHHRVTGNGYALADAAGRAGLDPVQYLDRLEARMVDIVGVDVDLADDSMPEIEQLVLPAIARQARRRAWNRVGTI